MYLGMSKAPMMLKTLSLEGSQVGFISDNKTIKKHMQHYHISYYCGIIFMQFIISLLYHKDIIAATW